MTESARVRFRDDSVYLSNFADDIDVVCPWCGGDALVNERSLTCRSCGKSAEPGVWFGPAKGSCSRACRYCRRRLTRQVSENPPKRTTFRIACPGCKHRTVATISWYGVRNAGHDPFFGAKLKLRRRCGRDLLWAYNQAHLRYIEDYVCAELRERRPNSNGSLASRMPRWIKSAKNRALVLKAVASLKAHDSSGRPSAARSD